jgi:hypothetical protein
VFALCASAAALAAAPIAAGACPSYAKVKAFHGFGSARFVESASGSDSIGGNVSVSLDHSATGIQYPSVTPAQGERHRVFIGKAKGGAVGVNDHYTQDDSPGPVTTGAQTASGPTVTGVAEIGFSPSGCTYVVSFSFGIATTSSGNWPNNGPSQFTPDLGVTGTAFSPVSPVPADLKLSGSATVDVNTNPTIGKGNYVPLGLDARNQWWNELDDLQDAKGLPDGTATISWNFSPGSGVNSCSVGGGGTTAGAAAQRRARVAQKARLARVVRRVRSLTSASRDPRARTAQATCGVNACCYEKTKEEMKADAKESARGFRNTTYVTGAIAIGLGLVSKPLGAVLGLITIAVNYGAGSASDVVAEPPDPNWRSIVKARPIGLVRAPANGFLGPAGTAALNAILRQLAIVNGLEHAFFVSHNRETSAKAAHSALWVKRQTAAMGRFAIQAGQAINQLITLVQQSRATLSNSFPTLTPADLKHEAAYVRAHGLPTSFVRLAHKSGLSAATLDAIKRRILAGTGLPSYATSIDGILSNPALISAEQAEANGLQAYGQLLLATG